MEGDWDAPAFVRGHGQLGGAVADLTYLGERLRDAHRQLGDSSFDLQAILGSLEEGVLIVDAAQRIRLANDSLLRMFDLAAPPLERTLMETFRNHELQATLRAALDEEGPQSQQMALDARQGSGYARKYFAVTAAALRPPDDERPRGAIAIFHDISELKALEGVRREFVANVSHELRTPVAIINGYLETLIDGALDDRSMAEKSVNVMWKHNQRLMLLIEDLLSLSQLEGKQAAALHFEPTDLRLCAVRVVERLESAIAEKGAGVRLALPPDLAADRGGPAPVGPSVFQPDRECAQVRRGRPAGDRGRRGDAGDGPGGDHRERQRAGHPGGGPATRVRAVLPGAEGPFARRGRNGAGAEHRQTRRLWRTAGR